MTNIIVFILLINKKIAHATLYYCSLAANIASVTLKLYSEYKNRRKFNLQENPMKFNGGGTRVFETHLSTERQTLTK